VMDPYKPHDNPRRGKKGKRKVKRGGVMGREMHTLAK